MKLGKYQHYKGSEYEVLGIVIHSETLEEMVLYKPLYQSNSGYDDKLWVRPKQMFNEQIEFNGIKTARFKKIED